jgi:hypothetical protein
LSEGEVDFDGEVVDGADKGEEGLQPRIGVESGNGWRTLRKKAGKD